MRLRDGDVYYLLTETRSGFPAVQIIPGHRIGQRDRGETHVAKGKYRGKRIEEGVISDRWGRVVAYRLLGATEKDDTEISSASLKHVSKSDYPEGSRGYPDLAHGLNDGRDALQAHEWERLKMLAVSAHTLIEHNETGAANSDPRNHFEDDGSTKLASGNAGEIETGTVHGGIYKTVRAGSGYKLEALEHKTPGETWESYQNRLARKLGAGVPWPLSFYWEANGPGGGVAERRDIMQARKTVEEEQTVLAPHARTIIGYAFKKLVKLGRVEDSPDWWRWSFSMPPKLTVDDGRVSKAMLEMWRAGVVSDEDLLDEMGKDHDEFYRNKFRRAVVKEQLFEEAQEGEGVELDSRYKGMFTPNDTPDDEDSTDD
jgi:capsid protein